MAPGAPPGGRGGGRSGGPSKGPRGRSEESDGVLDGSLKENEEALERA